MNYYTTPNYMNSYSYNQYPYVPQAQAQQQFNVPAQAQMPAPPAPAQALNGKIVDGEDVVKATEVPIGGYGVFPKADLSEIYLKTWNNNGTTSVVKFRPIVETPAADNETGNNFAQLMEKIDGIESKLDSLFASRNQASPPPQQKQRNEVIRDNGF